MSLSRNLGVLCVIGRGVRVYLARWPLPTNPRRRLERHGDVRCERALRYPAILRAGGDKQCLQRVFHTGLL